MARGPLWMILATVCFTGMVSLVKVGRISLGYGALELMVWRALAGIPVVWLLARGRLGIQRVDLMAVRCLFGFGAMFSYFSATRGLGIGELSVIVKLQPILVALGAPWALGAGERVDRRVYLAIALGMAGTLALVAPELSTLTPDPQRLEGAAWAFSAALCSAVAHTTLRALGATEDPRAVVFWFQLAVGAVALIALPSEGGLHAPTVGWGWGLLLGVGWFAALGQLAMTQAYKLEQAARVAAISYLAPLFGFVVDVLWFDDVPGPWSIVGAALVLTGGALVARGRG